jgi:hypothetical protein
MWPLVVYVGLVLALFVRFQEAGRTRRAAPVIASAADARLVRLQHRFFYALLLAAPLEWWWRGRPSAWSQVAGAAFAAARAA